MRNLDEKLKEVYDFTVSYVNENGFPPSVRDICSECNIKSTATAYSYLEKLKEKGYISKSPMKKRALTLNNGSKNYKTVPLIGTVRAGAPIFAVENLEGYFPLPEEFDFGKDEFALRVKGDSMINAGIKEKDIIIVSKQDTANEGEIVVALVDDSATVKRFFRRDGKIILHPENDYMQDLVYDEVYILGVVKGLLRKF